MAAGAEPLHYMPGKHSQTDGFGSLWTNERHMQTVLSVAAVGLVTRKPFASMPTSGLHHLCSKYQQFQRSGCRESGMLQVDPVLQTAGAILSCHAKKCQVGDMQLMLEQESPFWGRAD